MADPDPRPAVHQLDTIRRPVNGWWPATCGKWVRQRFVTRMGWKVTCDVCNPPARRKVRRVQPRPAPAAPELEDA